MDKEITDLESTHTWEVVTLPFWQGTYWFQMDL